MGYTFISYSSKNQQMADSFRTLFNQNGIKTWMAPGDIPFGSSYTSTINRAIKEASCFVLLLSESAQGSVWVLKETERAISTGKTIFTVLLDDVSMNDDFEFMLSTSQAVAIRKIDEDNDKTKRLIAAIKTYTDEEVQAKQNMQNTETDNNTYFKENAVIKGSVTHKKAKNIELTVWSPVNTDVFLNDKHNLVMRIDHNSGFDYKFNSIIVTGTFDLIFVANGFEKTISFDSTSIEDKLEYRLQAILSKREIFDSYDREEAIEQINIEPTAYAFEQLSEKGKIEDVDLLISTLINLTSKNNGDGQHDNYLIATCAKALGKLAVKYKRLDDLVFVLDVYENYEAKSSYGWMFDSIVKVLEKTHSRTSNNPKIDEAASLIQNKKAIVDGQIAAIQKRYPQYSDVQFCDSSLGSMYRAFDSENNIEVAIKIYSPEIAFHIPFFFDGGLFWDIKKLQADNLCSFIERQLSEPICLVMRYVQGETLEAYIKSTWRLNDNVKSILRFSLGILNGLNTLHNNNIYYGDLTPRNIIIDKNNVPWLCDFSESNYNGSRYTDKTVLVEKYRSPEKAPGKIIDCRSDIYEFGVILSDFLPFIRHDDCARDALFDIVKKATKENPDERFQSVSEIIDLLNGLNADSKANHVGLNSAAKAKKETFKGDSTETSTTSVSLKTNTNEIYQEHKASKTISMQQQQSTSGQKKRHFTAQTLSFLYKKASNIPERLVIPDKYQIIDTDILALLTKSSKVKIEEIIVPDSVEKILGGAFTRFSITNAITIPDSVIFIGEGAISLSVNAYVICSKNSYAYKYCRQFGLRNLPDLQDLNYAKIYAKLSTNISDLLLDGAVESDFDIREIVLADNHLHIKLAHIDTIKLNSSEYWVMGLRKDAKHMLFGVFKWIGADEYPNLVFITNGKKLKKVYRTFLDRLLSEYAGKYIVTDYDSFQPVIQEKRKKDKNVFSQNTAKGMFGPYLKSVIEIPPKYEVIAEHAFFDEAFKSSQRKVKKLIIPSSVKEICQYAFWDIVADEIIVPSSVTRIGYSAFNLSANGFIKCAEESFAYNYSVSNNLRNDVDIGKEYRIRGVCQHCGGSFKGIIKKVCTVCGKQKDY